MRLWAFSVFTDGLKIQGSGPVCEARSLELQDVVFLGDPFQHFFFDADLEAGLPKSELPEPPSEAHAAWS